MKYYLDSDGTWEGYCFIKPIENLSIADYEKYFDKESISYEKLCDVFSKGEEAEKKVPASVLKEEYLDDVIDDFSTYIDSKIDNLIGFDVNISAVCYGIDYNMSALLYLHNLRSILNDILYSETGTASGEMGYTYLEFDFSDTDMKIGICCVNTYEDNDNIVSGFITFTAPIVEIYGGNDHLVFDYEIDEDEFTWEVYNGDFMDFEDYELEPIFDDIRKNWKYYLKHNSGTFQETYPDL